MRSVPEWIGATPDAKIPDRVKLRIWEREGGRCYLSGLKINAAKDTFEYEHFIALCLGGEHRESNIGLALTAPHKIKTASDVKTRAKIDRIRKRRAGIKTTKGRPLPGTRASGWRKPFNRPPERWS